jgi:hypothetical protein
MSDNIDRDASVSRSSVRSWRSSNSGLTKVIVTIPGNVKIAVPTDCSTTVSWLQNEVLRRARALKLPTPSGDLVLRLESAEGPIAFPEDCLIDVLDITNDSTVWLGPMSVSEVRSILKTDLRLLHSLR